MDGTIRVRTAAWFATAVVLSVFTTLLVMQEWRADAAPGDSDATWVAVEPCRLFDYRPGEEPAGGKKTPLVAGAPATQQVTGNIGNCSVPTVGVVAVSMNVTVVQGTAQSNLRLYPADAANEPVVSNLNWKAGDSATANKVDIKLSSTGAVKVAVANGTVNVLGDVVGYYTNTSLKELQAQIDAVKAAPFAVSNSVDPVNFDNLTTSSSNVITVSVLAPGAGQVTVHSTADVKNFIAGEGVYCAITPADTALPPGGGEFRQAWGQPASWAGPGNLAGTRTFDIAAGATVEYALACMEVGANAANGGHIFARQLTAIFTPAP